MTWVSKQTLSVPSFCVRGRGGGGLVKGGKTGWTLSESCRVKVQGHFGAVVADLEKVGEQISRESPCAFGGTTPGATASWIWLVIASHVGFPRVVCGFP